MKQVGPKMPANMTNPLADLAIPPEDMIHLPVQPDSNSGFLFWPMSEYVMLIELIQFPDLIYMLNCVIMQTTNCR